MSKQGFSLIELMVVISILSLLLIFTYPNFNQAIVKTRRIDGQTGLLELAGRMEEYFSKNQSYLGAQLGTGFENAIMNSYSTEGWYQLQIIAQTAKNFELAAYPLKAQGREDQLCQTLTFNSVGQKGILSGPSGAPKGKPSDCW